MALLTGPESSICPRLRSSLPRVFDRFTINLNHADNHSTAGRQVRAKPAVIRTLPALRKRAGARPRQGRKHRTRAHDGCAARRPSGAGAAGAAPGRSRGGIDLRQPGPVRAERRLRQLSANLGRRSCGTGATQGRPGLGAERRHHVPGGLRDSDRSGRARARRAGGCLPSAFLRRSLHRRRQVAAAGPARHRDCSGRRTISNSRSSPRWRATSTSRSRSSACRPCASKDGLALSSRNAYLSAGERAARPDAPPRAQGLCRPPQGRPADRHELSSAAAPPSSKRASSWIIWKRAMPTRLRRSPGLPTARSGFWWLPGSAAPR